MLTEYSASSLSESSSDGIGSTRCIGCDELHDIEYEVMGAFLASSLTLSHLKFTEVELMVVMVKFLGGSLGTI